MDKYIFHIVKLLPIFYANIFIMDFNTEISKHIQYIKFLNKMNLWCICFNNCHDLSHFPLFQPAPAAVTPLLLPANRLDGGHRVPQHWHGGPGTGARTTVPHVSLLQRPVSVPVLIFTLPLVDYRCQQCILLMLAWIVCVSLLSNSCWRVPQHYEIVIHILIYFSVRYKRQAL